MKLRILNEFGLEIFREYLDNLRNGLNEPPPLKILNDKDTSVSIDDGPEIEQKKFANRRDVAVYLKETLEDFSFTELESNIGLWSWLDLFFFDQTCPVNPEGKRNPKADYRHILSLNFRHKYRHLLFGPYRIYVAHTNSAFSLLCGDITKPGDFNEQVGSRIEKVSNGGIIQILDLLYYDREKDKVKRGASDRKKKGNLRRFIDVTDQFDVTYDLFSMTTENISKLLPEEFDEWR